ncbi:tRNA pseudouridine synthase A [termite gut metagenome]|uniref:tRNA pseudouridine synthase A n=1 Tax=termite gut metagenome TaxID=433724 RepID=A0A5J4QSH5_9ZZZZ
MKRYFIYLSYDGTNYHGWQIQPNGISIQECVEKTLSILLRVETKVVGAGRTDAGVHALLMVAHFDYEGKLPDLFIEKLNGLLPSDISVYKVCRVREDAHARFDASARIYRYYISMGKCPFYKQYRYWVHGEIDFDRMNEAAQTLLDYSDFTSFSKLHTNVKTNLCGITRADWMREDEITWVFTIRADRFLRNMVRAIVGTLFEVGRRRWSVEDFRRVIEQRDRCKAGGSVPGYALFLADVEYEENVFLPF